MKNGTVRPDVLVVGGGIIGLAIAESVAATGRSVTLVERDRCGHGASWAAGGMLSPLAEAEEPGPFLSLARSSLELYPEWARRIGSDSGIDTGFRLDGKTLVALDAEDARRLRKRWDWQTAAGHDVRWLEGPQVHEVEPQLTDDVTAALHLPGDGRVNNRALVRGLAAVARGAGVEIREGVEVSGLRFDAGAVSGVETRDGPIAAGIVVLAAGAWAPELVGTRPNPIKGQMLSLIAEDRPLRAVVSAPGAYLIPRDTPEGHRVVVGATMEEVGFDLSTDEETLEVLRRAAVRAVPALSTAPVAERWAGLRPGSSDGLPVIGPDPTRPGLLHAHAHHRNGVLLAPVTASYLVGWIEGRPPSDATAFTPR